MLAFASARGTRRGRRRVYERGEGALIYFLELEKPKGMGDCAVNVTGHEVFTSEHLRNWFFNRLLTYSVVCVCVCVIY